MANLDFTFNPSDVPEDERSFEPLPAGLYNVQIIESEVRPSKSGQMLRLTLEVMDGPKAGRRIWDNLNIQNRSQQAQQIAQRALADICQAVGCGALQDSEELHFKPLVADVKIVPERTDENTGNIYPPSNGVKRYKARGGQPPAGKAPVQQRQAAPQQAARPNGSAPSRPWANRAQPEAARQVPMDDVPF